MCCGVNVAFAVVPVSMIFLKTPSRVCIVVTSNYF